MPWTYPLPHRCWWISPGRILGGPNPGGSPGFITTQNVNALLKAGVRRVISLQSEDERRPDGKPFVKHKFRSLLSEGLVVWSRHPIPNHAAPSVDVMREILAAIAAAEGIVYVHCDEGHGRTGTVAGCWLREQGYSADEVSCLS